MSNSTTPSAAEAIDLFTYMDEVARQRQTEAARILAETPAADVDQDVDQGDTDSGRPRDYARQFLAFHARNRHVYRLFEHRARQHHRDGVRCMGTDLLLGGIRYDFAVVVKGETYKINNNHASFLVRLLLHRNPHLGDMFTTRRSIADVDRSWIAEADAIDGYTGGQVAA